MKLSKEKFFDKNPVAIDCGEKSRTATAEIRIHRSAACLKTGQENVGLVRFELTIDGSLRHASVLQRVIIVKTQETHCSSSASTKERKDRWSPSPYRARPQPRAASAGMRYPVLTQ